MLGFALVEKVNSAPDHSRDHPFIFPQMRLWVWRRTPQPVGVRIAQFDVGQTLFAC